MRTYHFKLLPLALATLLSACGQEDPGGDSSSSSISSSSSTSSVTSSSSSVSSIPSGSVARGKSIVEGSQCILCHQDDNQDGVFTGIASIDVDNLTYDAIEKYKDKDYSVTSMEGLAQFIQNEMPPGSPCDAQCASDVASYLWFLKDGIPGPRQEDVSCTDPNGIHYGMRALRLLTSYEYNNSLKELFGSDLPADYSDASKIGLDTPINNLPNHFSEAVNETRMNTYFDRAQEVARWAVNSGAIGINCSLASACADDFIDDFAYVAFRRPLTTDEKASYRDMITKASNLNSGLEWAIRTVLSSPQFLYRSELGMKVSDALDAPPLVPQESLTFAGTPTTYTEESLNDNVLELYERIATGQGMNYTFTGDDLVRITVRATRNDGGDWPTLRIGGNGSDIALMEIAHGGSRTYTFHLTGLTGNQYVYFENASVNGHNPGHSIEIVSLQFGAATEAEAKQDNREKLLAADPNAYVLDAFEYASALAFTFTGSTPSRDLLDAASRGELFDASTLEQHVETLMNSTAGREHVGRLAGYWFRTNGVLEVSRMNVPEFTADVKESMAQEIREIYAYAFYNNLPLSEIYRGNFTLLDATLADFYGLPGGGSGHMDFEYVDTTDSSRGGILASGAYMAFNAHNEYSSPIKRSVHLRQDMLCQIIPLPTKLGDGAAREEATRIAEEKQAQGNLTTNDFYDIQTNVPGTSCADCHNAIINPLFGLDDFDEAGRLRKRVNGQVVQTAMGPTGNDNVPIAQVNDGGFLYGYDAVGHLTSASADAAKASGDGLKFYGAKDLGRTMADNELPGLRACLIEKTTRFAMGHSLEAVFSDATEASFQDNQKKDFACVREDLINAYDGSNASPRAVMKALGMSDMMRFRR